MAIAFDSSVDGGVTILNTVTFAFNNVAGDWMNVGFRAGILDDATGVTYNGVAMTQTAKVQNATSGRYAYLYTLTAPATGSHDVVITTTAADELRAGAASYSGVKQTGQPTGAATAQADDGTGTVNVTTTDDNSWVAGMLFGQGGAAWTGTNSTNLRQIIAALSNGYMIDKGPVTPAAATTISGTHTAGTWWILGCAIAPAAVVASSLPYKSLLGVGK